MAQLLVGPDSVTVQLGPWEQLGSFQRTFSFPRSAVESVQVVDRPWQAIRQTPFLNSCAGRRNRS